MIEVNSRPIEVTKFPDGTLSLHYAPEHIGVFHIIWRYDGDEECMIVWNLVHHIRSHYPGEGIMLFLPYVPNARMDRVKSGDEVFTLKWFAEFINYLEFERVFITDPHSNVCTALIDRAVVCDAKGNVMKARMKIGGEVLLCYPDSGATKKYVDLFQDDEYVFGIKDRDWKTGRIKGLVLNNVSAVKGRDVLIVDDICSRGGTFMHTAKALKDAEACKVYLYVTHCENTIFEGDILKTDLIEHVYTTDSIYRGEHPKITIL